ncbi:hypothetical protein [Kribbella sp. NPDC050459]|uniref:hypothetical protein n=1 Tax=Kribbella sp. NPDC050459 TaxID=3155785 RepID=UPI0033C90F79
MSERAVQRLGLGLTVGTLAWAASIFVFTTDPHGIPGRIGDLTGLLFQIGIFCLLAVQYRTGAIGTGRAARRFLKAEAVILGIASLWSLLHGVLPTDLQSAAWLAPMDVCWPLSMLGMAVIAVKLAVTGRWQGVLRWWPLVAESWAVVTVPSYILLGTEASRWVGGTHLLIGYATLGILLTRNPRLVLPRT